MRVLTVSRRVTGENWVRFVTFFYNAVEIKGFLTPVFSVGGADISVAPAKAGAHRGYKQDDAFGIKWVPAFAGTTKGRLRG